MFQNGQKVVVVSSGDPARVVKVQAVSDGDASRYPVVDTTGVTNRDQHVQIVSGGDPTRYPQLRGLATARDTADAVITALSPAAWYRNATGVTSAGGFASQWDDYSGNGRHLVQATGTNQPAYAAGVFLFDGADNWIRATYASTQPRTRYIVYTPVTWADTDHVINGSSANVALYQVTLTPRLEIFAGSSAAANTGHAVGALAIDCVVFNGASSSLRVNNNAKTTGNAGANNPGGFTIAAQNNGLAGWSNIAVYEAIDFAAAHSDAEQDSVITALANALSVTV